MNARTPFVANSAVPFQKAYYFFSLPFRTICSSLLLSSCFFISTLASLRPLRRPPPSFFPNFSARWRSSFALPHLAYTCIASKRRSRPSSGFAARSPLLILRVCVCVYRFLVKYFSKSEREKEVEEDFIWTATLLNQWARYFSLIFFFF